MHSQIRKLVADLRVRSSVVFEIEGKPIRIHGLASEFLLRAGFPSDLKLNLRPDIQSEGRVFTSAQDLMRNGYGRSVVRTPESRVSVCCIYSRSHLASYPVCGHRSSEFPLRVAVSEPLPNSNRSMYPKLTGPIRHTPGISAGSLPWKDSVNQDRTGINLQHIFSRSTSRF
jgi:hypothetical protein